MSHLGPGTYEVDKSLTITEKNKHQVKIGNMKRFSGQYKTISPGPSKYEANKTEKDSEHK